MEKRILIKTLKLLKLENRPPSIGCDTESQRLFFQDRMFNLGVFVDLIPQGFSCGFVLSFCD